MGSKYDREFNLGKGTISIETIIDDKGLQAFVRTLERIGSGSGLDKYVVGVNGSLKNLDAALEEVSSAAKRFDASVSTANAQELVKQVRAFEAIGGAPIKNIVSNYEELGPVIERAAEMAGNLGKNFSSQAFNDAAVGFAAFTKAGGDAGDFIKRFGEDTELLQKQIGELTRELGYYKAEVDRLEKEAGENGVEQLKSLKKTMAEELGAFITANNIDKNDYMFSDLFEDIENGSKTAGQAIAEFKSNYGYLLEELRGSGNAIDSSKIDNMVTSLSVLYDMLEEVRNGVRAIIEDGVKVGEVVPAEASDGMERAADSAKELSKGIESIEKVAPVLEGVADAEIKAGDGAAKSYGSITDLVNTLKQFGEIGPDSLKSVQLSLYNLSNIKGINVGAKSKENIISLLTDISTLSFAPGGLSVISAMNFNAFKELKVSKASLDNLATYLPQIARIPVDNLINLSKVDLHNFNDLHISKTNLEPIKEMTTASDKMVEATEVMKTSLENIREVAGQTLRAFVQPEDTASVEQLTADVDMLASEAESVPASADHASEGIDQIGESAKMTSDAILKMEGELEAANDITAQLKKDTEKVSPKGDSTSDASDREALEHGMAKLYATRKKLNEEMANGVDITATLKRYHDEQEEQRSLINGLQDIEAERKREAEVAKKAAAEKAAADKKEAEALAKRIADAKKADEENAKKQAEQNDSYISNNPITQNQYLSSISNLLKTTGAEYLRYTQVAENGTRNVIQGYESQEESVKALAIAMKDLEELRGMVENGEDMSTSDVSQLYTDAKAKIDMATEALFKYEQATGSVSSAETRRLEQLDKIQKAMNAVQAEMNAYTDEKTGYGAAGKETATYAEMERAYEALKKYHAEITATGADTGKDVVTNNQFAESFNKINARAKLAVDAAKAKIAADKESIKTTAAAADAEKRREEEQGKINQAMRVGETLLNKIAAAQRNWTAAASGTTSDAYSSLQGYADKVRQANRELSTGAIDAKKYRETIAGLSNDFDNTSRTIAGAGENMRSFGDRIGDITSKFGMWLSTSRIIMTIVRYLKQMITTTIELDDAMTQLRIVTGETDSTYEKFGNTVAESAKKLGVSMKDLIDATTTYSRLGYSLEESSTLAELTTMVQQVGDIDASSAQDAITAIIKAFDIDTSHIGTVMDEMVVVGNNFPVSVSQLAEAMNNASSALAASGNSVEESMALITAAITTSQNASKASTGLRTIAARIRNTKAELDELGEEVIATAKYEEMVSTLTKHQVKLIDEENGQYRSTYDIIKDLAGVWDEMSSAEQAALATTLAGVRQQEVLFSLINQFKEASGAMDAMGENGANAAGSLEKAYGEFTDSTTARINMLKASFAELGQDIYSRDLLNGVVDIGTKALDFIDKIVNKLGGISGTLILVGSLLAFKNLDKTNALFLSLIKSIFSADKGLGLLINSIKVAKGAANSAGEGFKFVVSEMTGLSFGASVATAGITALVSILAIAAVAIKKHRQNVRDANDAIIENGKTSVEEASNIKSLYDEYEAIRDQYENGTSSKKEYETATRSLAEALGVENDAVSGLSDSYKNLTLQELDRARLDAYNAVEAAKDNLQNTVKTSYEKSQNITAWAQQFYGWGYFSATAYKDADKIVTIYNRLQKEYDNLTRKKIQGAKLTREEERAYSAYEKTLGWLREDVEEYTSAKYESSKANKLYHEALTGETDELEKNGEETENAAQSVEKYADALRELRDGLDEAGTALDEYNQKLEESGEKGDIAASYDKAYDKFLEDWKAGKTGTNAVKAAVELFIPEDKLKELGYDVEEAGKILASDLYQAIFNVEDSDDYGANFANIIRKNIDAFAGVAEIIDNNNGTFDFAYSSVEELAEAFERLGMSVDTDVLAGLLDDLDKYGVQAVQGWEATRQLASELGLVANQAENSREKIENIASVLASRDYDAPGIRAMLDTLEEAGYINLDGVSGSLGEIIDNAIETQKKVEDLQDTAGEGAEMDIDTNAPTTLTALDKVERKFKSLNGQKAVMTIQTVQNSTTNSKSGSVGYKKITEGTAATGTKKSRGGKTLVNELGPELISENGKAYIANNGEPAVVDLDKDAIVLTADETKKALKYKKSNAPIHSAANGKKIAKVETALDKKTEINITIETDSTTGGKPTGNYGNDNPMIYGDGSTLSSDNNVSKTTTTSSGKSTGAGGIPKNSSKDKTKESTSGSKTSSGSSGSSSKEKSAFEKEYERHQHLLAMEQETDEEYFKWLKGAYEDAYKKGQIELDDYRKYAEEVHKLEQELFEDSLNDLEFKIEMLEYESELNVDEITALYKQMLGMLEEEIAAAYASGLDDNSDYLQKLKRQYVDYQKELDEIQESTTEDAKEAIDALVQYRVKMLKKEIEEQKEALSKELDEYKKFIDKQKEMLQDQADEEDYLEGQQERRKTISDIEAELAALQYDNSAWAQKRRLELEEQLAEAKKDLDDYERDYARQQAMDALDDMYEAREEEANKEIELLNEKLEDEKSLYEQALEDIRNSSQELYEEMVEYGLKYNEATAEEVRKMWEDAYKAMLKYKELAGENYEGIDLVNATGYESEEKTVPGNTPPSDSNGPEKGATGATLDDATKKKVAAAIWTGGYGWGSGDDRKKKLTEVFGADNGIQEMVNNGVGKNDKAPSQEYTYLNMRKKFKGYASGTRNATAGLHRFDELGEEYYFQSANGDRYKMFSAGDKVLDAKATDFLYDFAQSGGKFFNEMFKEMSEKLFNGFRTNPSPAPIINMGDIVINGSANEKTVSEIRRAQREGVDYLLKQFSKLQRT